MSMTQEERESIIAEALERAMLIMPEVIGNLMATQAAHAQINKKFYAEHPEFRGKEMIVASVIEQLDGQNPGIDYGELIEKAIPAIKERIEQTKNLDVTSAPAVDGTKITLAETSSNGAI